MNRIENISGPENAYVFSVGGSVLFAKPTLGGVLRALILDRVGFNYNPVVFNKYFIDSLMGMSCELIGDGVDQNKLVMITGGGKAARNRIADTMEVAAYVLRDQSYVVVSEEAAEQQDHVGKTCANLNATELLAVAKLVGIPSYWYAERLFGNAPRGKLGVRGGTDTKQTTDMVAAVACRNEKATYVINIGVDGVHPVKSNGKLDTSVVIPHLTAAEYLDMIEDTDHFPGKNVPFERPAAELAATNGMGVILVGPDMKNLKNLLFGEEFVGTVITPN